MKIQKADMIPAALCLTTKEEEDVTKFIMDTIMDAQGDNASVAEDLKKIHKKYGSNINMYTYAIYSFSQILAHIKIMGDKYEQFQDFINKFSDEAIEN